jgi:16S rRNA (cytidine1402-2'-O)-methyltransferase
MLQPLLEGRDMGLLSEAGLPAVADPGSGIVALAHQKGIQVVPLTGPSSLMLALMASGLNGQSFAFAGYLPVKSQERKAAIKQLEKRAAQENQTQLFIETPYRNMALLGAILETCAPQTMLCVAANLTTSDAFVATKTVAQWRSVSPPPIHKIPTVFALQA